MPDASPNGWGEWSRHVLAELKRLNDSIEKILAKTVDNEKKIIALNGKMDGRTFMCNEHKEDIIKIEKLARGNRDSIMSHRLITAIISAVTSLATAVLVAWIAMRGPV